MNTKLIFVRHAEPLSYTYPNVNHINLLTLKGIKQAELCGLLLKNIGITEFFCADNATPKQTALIIAQTIGFNPMDIIIDKSYNELKFAPYTVKIESDLLDLLSCRGIAILVSYTKLIQEMFKLLPIKEANFPVLNKKLNHGVPIVYDVKEKSLTSLFPYNHITDNVSVWC